MQRIQAETQSSGRDTSYVQIQQNASKTREAVKSKAKSSLVCSIYITLSNAGFHSSKVKAHSS